MQHQSRSVILYLLSRDYSKEKIAEMAGLTSKRMIDYTLSGEEKQIGRKAIQRIAENLGFTEMELLSKAVAHSEQELGKPNKEDLIFRPLLEARPRGGEGGHETEETILDWFAFNISFLQKRGNPESMYLFEVAGESMSPTINEGDTILVDISNKEFIPGKISLFELNDTFLVKRADIKPGFFRLKSDNKDKDNHPDIEIPMDSPDHFAVYGRVIWVSREL